MRKILKQSLAVIVLVLSLFVIIRDFNAATIVGIHKMLTLNIMNLTASLIIVSYLLYRIYSELSHHHQDIRSYFQVGLLITVSMLLVVNNMLFINSTSLTAVRFAVLYRFVMIWGLILLSEYYLFNKVYSKVRIVFSTIMIAMMVLLFVQTEALIPSIALVYYLIALVYLLINYLKWQVTDDLVGIISFSAVMIVVCGLVNDLLMILYGFSLELTFVTVSGSIVLITIIKNIKNHQRYKEKLEEIKNLKIKLDKMKSVNQDAELSFAKLKNDLSSRFNLKQNYYENLELVIDVLNTNILVINEEFKVELCYGSAFDMEEIGGVEVSKALFDVFSDDGQYFQSVVKKVFDAQDDVRETLFLSLLDQKLMISGRNYSMSYFVMQKHNEDKILIIHADANVDSDYDEQANHEREVADMVAAIVRNADMFFADWSSYLDFCKVKTTLLNSEDSIADNIFKILRRVHTYKGVFDQYNMKSSVRAINDIENELFNMLHNSDNMTLDQFSRVLIGYDMESVLRTDLMVLKHQLGERFFQQKSKVNVDITDLNRLYLKVNDLLGADHVITKELEQLKQLDVFEVLESYEAYVSRIAEEQGKYVNFKVTGQHFKVNRRTYIEFFESMIHIIKNAVTHGVEYPDERRLAGKNETATIECHIEATDQKLLMTISDDGRGIDVKEIKNRLFILGKFSIEALDKLSDDEICSMVIEDGVTSYMTPSVMAGRGVGMGSIREVVENIGGSIEVKSVSGMGVGYEIVLPLDKKEDLVRVSHSEILENLCLQSERVLTKAEKKSTLSSTWYMKDIVLDESVLLDVSAIITAKGHVERTFIVTADEAFLYQLIGSYGLHLKYKGANLKVLNEAITRFLEDIASKTIEELKSNRQNVKVSPGCIMSQRMFNDYCYDKHANCAELDIAEGKIKILIINNHMGLL